MSAQYRIYITPTANGSNYGTEIEVSGIILQSGINTMKKSIDSGDYDVGIYTYGDVTLKLVNEDGYLNENDSRSIFMFGRDKAKVRISYDDGDTETDIFKGLINDEGTRQNVGNDEIEFKVISQDSTIRTAQVAGGAIGNGINASDAIKAILNQPEITKVLTYSAANINVGYDFVVDDGSELENRSAKDSLNQLLFATNSVFLIDINNNMVVQSRSTYPDGVTSLKGPYVRHADQNIIDITSYNTGRHRMFNSVKVNTEQYVQTPYVRDFGFKQKNISFPFITSTNTAALLARELSEEFKLPKVECAVYVPTHVARDLDLMSLVSVDWPLRTKPVEGKFLPIVGATKIGDAEMPLPYTYGSLAVHKDTAFKVIEISEDPKNFMTHLKLRQTGFNYEDGELANVLPAAIGYAIIGQDVISIEGDACNTYNPSVVAAARIGCTLVA